MKNKNIGVIMWKIIRDYQATRNKTKPNKPQSEDWNEEEAKNIHLYKFRLLDEFGKVYCCGVCDSSEDIRAFEPLDDYGIPYLGCTNIEYKDETYNEYCPLVRCRSSTWFRYNFY